MQLLNRNPLNRLGATRGTDELKEHPFFDSIDWDLLYKKQITPPFKPIVDSDESVANFDPEFTNSSLQDAGIQPWDVEEDNSSGLAGSVGTRGHSYVGPGGSLSSASNMPKPSGMAINKQSRPPLAGGGGSPLTSSVQENFRGFTYTGESLMVRLVFLSSIITQIANCSPSQTSRITRCMSKRKITRTLWTMRMRMKMRRTTTRTTWMG